MRILSDLDSFHPENSKPVFLGLGNFDGLHLGHQALISHVMNEASRHAGIAALLTFQEHPQRVLNPKKSAPLLMTAEHKLALLAERGMDLCLWLAFTHDFSKLTAKEFVEKILVKKIRVKEVCMGYNAYFGHNREGNVQVMRELAARFGFGFEQVDPVKIAGDFVSSSRVRRLVSSGELREAAECLGRPFSVLGKVIGGASRGRELGFPTANLEILSEVLPLSGVYPCRVRFMEAAFQETRREAERILTASRGEWQDGVLNFGFRPTFQGAGPENKKAVFEVHLFDFDRDIYGKSLEVAIFPRLREEIRFKDPQSLRRQIMQDAEKARSYLKSLV